MSGAPPSSTRLDRATQDLGSVFPRLTTQKEACQAFYFQMVAKVQVPELPGALAGVL